MNKCAYVTLVTNEKFLPCVIKCAESLQYYQSKYPLIAMIPENNVFLKNNLTKYNILCKEIKIDKLQDNCYLHYNDTINKFQIFNLTEYDYLCFLDADIIFFQGNIDSEFEKAQKENASFYGYFEGDHNEGVEIGTRLMGGLFIIQPNLTVYPEILHIIKKYNFEFICDEEILKLLFKEGLKKHQVPHFYTHFGDYIKVWEKIFTPSSFVSHFFYDDLSSEELGYWLDNPDLFLGRVRCQSNNWTKRNYFSNRGFFIFLQTPQDIISILNLQKQLIKYGSTYSLIICIDKTLYSDDLIQLLDSNWSCFILFDNCKFKNIYQQIKFLEQHFKEDYIRICLITNINFQIKENLDLLLQTHTDPQIKKDILKKYESDLIYLNLEEI